MSPSSVAEALSEPVAGVPASFRDPYGFVFERGGVLLRQVNAAAQADYDLLFSSGLYGELADTGDLIAHEEVDTALAAAPGAYRVLRPERVPFISYPYEWSFGQLKDAALLTLRLQGAAMRHGMSLRDATACNVQFHRGRPVWIDTLSFERRPPGRPWVAYRQFCEFFLAPLALMARRDIRLQHLLRAYVDGIPLDLASRVLPWRTRASPGLLVHVHLHAAAQRRAARTSDPAPRRRVSMSDTASTALLDSLQRTVRSLEWAPRGTVWADYYGATNYTDAAFAHKRDLVRRALDRFAPSVVWDLGANDGTFSHIAAERGIRTIAFDVDPAAVEKHYRRVVEQGDPNTLPLLLDLANPSGPCGWAGRERAGLDERGEADVLLALALVHHLAIGHNVPLPGIADYFASLGRALVIEFVPKQDSQVQRMLASRQDVFTGYAREPFEAAFRRRFEILDATPVRDSDRVLYTMIRRDP